MDLNDLASGRDIDALQASCKALQKSLESAGETIARMSAEKLEANARAESAEKNIIDLRLQLLRAKEPTSRISSDLNKVKEECQLLKTQTARATLIVKPLINQIFELGDTLHGLHARVGLEQDDLLEEAPPDTLCLEDREARVNAIWERHRGLSSQVSSELASCMSFTGIIGRDLERVITAGLGVPWVPGEEQKWLEKAQDMGSEAELSHVRAQLQESESDMRYLQAVLNKQRGRHTRGVAKHRSGAKSSAKYSKQNNKFYLSDNLSKSEAARNELGRIRRLVGKEEEYAPMGTFYQKGASPYFTDPFAHEKEWKERYESEGCVLCGAPRSARTLPLQSSRDLFIYKRAARQGAGFDPDEVQRQEDRLFRSSRAIRVDPNPLLPENVAPAELNTERYEGFKRAVSGPYGAELSQRAKQRVFVQRANDAVRRPRSANDLFKRPRSPPQQTAIWLSAALTAGGPNQQSVDAEDSLQSEPGLCRLDIGFLGGGPSRPAPASGVGSSGEPQNYDDDGGGQGNVLTDNEVGAVRARVSLHNSIRVNSRWHSAAHSPPDSSSRGRDRRVRQLEADRLRREREEEEEEEERRRQTPTKTRRVKMWMKSDASATVSGSAITELSQVSEEAPESRVDVGFLAKKDSRPRGLDDSATLAVGGGTDVSLEANRAVIALQEEDLGNVSLVALNLDWDAEWSKDQGVLRSMITEST
jgi:hypothetical protein